MVNSDNVTDICTCTHKRDDQETGWEVHFNYSRVQWIYDSKGERDQEYEWIVSILDCKINNGIINTSEGDITIKETEDDTPYEYSGDYDKLGHKLSD